MTERVLPMPAKGHEPDTPMSLRLLSATALIAAAFLQPACATSPMPERCTISGPSAALPGMDAAAVCARFESELVRALGGTALPEGLTIALTLHKRGGIDADLSLAGADTPRRLPRVSVDVSDRALRADDLAALARGAAQLLAGDGSAQDTRRAAQAEGE